VHQALLLQGQEAFLEGHVHAFERLGVPVDKIRYDNLNSAVKQVLFGRCRQENEGPIGDKRQRARRRGDGQRGNASVLTKGMNPADRLAGDASASLTGRHPLIGDLPRQLNNQTLDGPSFESQRLGPPPGERGGGPWGLAVPIWYWC